VLYACAIDESVLVREGMDHINGESKNKKAVLSQGSLEKNNRAMPQRLFLV